MPSITATLPRFSTNRSDHSSQYLGAYLGALPELNRENVTDTSVSRLEVSNNVFWGARAPTYLTTGAPNLGQLGLPWQLDIVGNYAVDDPGDTLAFGRLALEPGPDLAAGHTCLFQDEHMRTLRPKTTRWYNSNDFLEAIATMGTPLFVHPVRVGPARPAFALPPCMHRTQGQPS